MSDGTGDDYKTNFVEKKDFTQQELEPRNDYRRLKRLSIGSGVVLSAVIVAFTAFNSVDYFNSAPRNSPIMQKYDSINFGLKTSRSELNDTSFYSLQMLALSQDSTPENMNGLANLVTTESKRRKDLKADIRTLERDSIILSDDLEYLNTSQEDETLKFTYHKKLMLSVIYGLFTYILTASSCKRFGKKKKEIRKFEKK